MTNATVYIEKLKIVDCADDDEDMDLRLKVHVLDPDGKRRRVYSYKYEDEYVEEEGKIGSDARCTFFKGVRVEGIANVAKVEITVHLSTLDGDGLSWGGKHVHMKDLAGLKPGRNDFNERKEQSSNSKGRGVYELEYTIYKEST